MRVDDPRLPASARDRVDGVPRSRTSRCGFGDRPRPRGARGFGPVGPRVGPPEPFGDRRDVVPGDHERRGEGVRGLVQAQGFQGVLAASVEARPSTSGPAASPRRRGRGPGPPRGRTSPRRRCARPSVPSRAAGRPRERPWPRQPPALVVVGTPRPWDPPWDPSPPFRPHLTEQCPEEAKPFDGPVAGDPRRAGQYRRDGGPRNRTWRCGFGDRRVTDTPVPLGLRSLGASCALGLLPCK
jgi:hypothetical protein